MVRQHAQVQVNPQIQGHQGNSCGGCHRIHRLDNDIDCHGGRDVKFTSQTRQSRTPKKMSGGLLLQVKVDKCPILHSYTE